MITGFYAGLLGLIYLGLSALVIRQRLGNQIGVGDNGNQDVLRAVRVHANFAEYVPFALILMAAVEVNAVFASSVYLHVAGIALIIARLAHAYGLSKSVGTSPGRFMGTIVTFLILAVLSVALIIQYATA